MAYDDDGSIIGWRDWSELEAFLSTYLVLPENISFERLREGVTTLSQLSRRGSIRDVTIYQVDEALRHQRVAGMPFSFVVGLLEAVSRHSGDVDRMTVKELEEILQHARRR
jgi:hypothetical protein